MTRPLIICDVDEVAVEFVAGFDRFLAAEGLTLGRDRFALSGNIFDAEGQAIADSHARALIDAYQGDAVHSTGAVRHMPETLAQLSRQADICFLSNVADEQAERRRAHLQDLGAPYPLYANKGPKGPATRRLADAHRETHSGAPVVFIDDSPHHLQSAADAVTDIILIHFIADAAFRALVRPAPHVALLTGDWQVAGRFIATLPGIKDSRPRGQE